MPLLEAPTNFDDESSTDNSMASDIAVVGNVVPALAQLRLQTPDHSAQRTVNVRPVGNTFGGVRLPTIRLHTQRTLAQTQAAAAAAVAGNRATAAAAATTTATGNTTTRQRPLLRAGDIFAELEAEAIETLNYEGLGPAPAPAAVVLPVNLPPQVVEPQLDELLRRVTQRNDLQNVETVRLRVISAITVSLSRLALFLPRLQHLDLSGSVLCSLRDLGCGLIHLAHLNVSNCGLTSFDGTSGMPALRTLIANGNMIQLVGPLTQLPLLQHLSAQNNRISDLGLLTFLAMCPNLLEIELQGNPVCHLPLYRHTLQRNISTLRRIDGLPVVSGGGDDDEHDVDGNDVDIASTSIPNNIEQGTPAERPTSTNQTSLQSSASSLSSSSSSIPNTASENDALSSLSSEYQAAVDEPYAREQTRTTELELSSASFSSATSDVAAARLSNSLLSLSAGLRCLRRPATAPSIAANITHGHEQHVTLSERPDSASNLNGGPQQQGVLPVGAAGSTIVAGSVLDLVRSNRRRARVRGQRTAWLAQSSRGGSISSTSSSSLEPVVEIEPFGNL